MTDRWHTRAAAFVLIGLALYALLYAGAEVLVYRTAAKNRFFAIAATPATAFDTVILGASRAMPLDFEDMNAELERLTGGRIANLALEGGGILPNRLLLEYFFTRHSARRVVYVLDSFAVYSGQWNEERLADANLLQRAPLDFALMRVLWRHPWSRPLLPAYASGFGKINDRKRFEPDVSDAERNLFRRSYRPVAFLDRQRIAYLYPAKADPVAREKYFAELRSLIALARAHAADVVIVRPPLPERVINLLPGEAEFATALATALAPDGVAIHDFSRMSNRDANFYNTDHLNRDGVLAFMREQLAPALRQP